MHEIFKFVITGLVISFTLGMSRYFKDKGCDYLRIFKAITTYLNSSREDFGLVVLDKNLKPLFITSVGEKIYNHITQFYTLEDNPYFNEKALTIDKDIYRVKYVCIPNHETCFIAYSNITESYNTQKELVRASVLDPLTGLANRNYLLANLQKQLNISKRRYSKFALLYCDINKFKQINDTYGHLVGDFVLKEISKHLVSSVRPQDTVARISGDEFNILLVDADEHIAVRVAKRIKENLKQGVFYKDRYIPISTAIGIGIHNFEDSEDKLIRKADLAMYQAKQKCHRSNESEIELYSDSKYSSLETELALETKLQKELKKDVENSNLYMVFQPVWSIHQEKVTGFEALIRWRDKEKDEVIYPDRFIPIAEKSGLINDIFYFGLSYVCDFVYQVRKDYPKKDFVYAINLSPKTLERRDFIMESVKEIFTKYEIPEKYIDFEITETLGYELDVDLEEEATRRVLRLLWELRNKGHQISLDDWGTGYSSIKRVLELPLNIVKIDKYFIFDLENDISKQNIVKAIIDLSKSISLKIVAEGVQEEAQLEILKEMGCDYIQGYLISKPLTLEQVKEQYYRNG